MKSVFIATAILFSLFAQAKTHVLKKGETLANVARMYYGEPVWGPKGSIKKIYKLNPWALSSPNLVEPGQSVVIDDDSASAVPAPVIKAEAIPIETVGPVVTSESAATIIKETTPLPPIESLKKTEPLVVAHEEPAKVETPSVSAPVPPAPPTEPIIIEKPEILQQVSGPKSAFFISPVFTTSKIKVNDVANTTSYDLSSNSTYGVKLGWDHWWTKSFSTIFSYTAGQMKSTALNDTTGNTFADSMTTSSFDLLFLNKLGNWGRFGLGAAYSTFLFIENFTGTPANPEIYKVSYWHPLLNLQLNLFSVADTEFLLDLQASPLPADVGHDHDLMTGAEYVARLGLIHSLGSYAASLGVSYLENSQSRLATQQSRKDTIFDIGVRF